MKFTKGCLKMKIAQVRFKNYRRVYAFNTKLDLVPGKMYKIDATGANYATPVIFQGYTDKGPAGIELREIINAEEVEEPNI